MKRRENQAEGDRFEAEAPRGFAAARREIEARTAVLAELAPSGRTSESDVAAGVAAYRAGRVGERGASYSLLVDGEKIRTRA